MEFKGGFADTLNFLEERTSKEWVGIPNKYERMKPFISYWEKGTYLLISAGSGIGKTLFTVSDWLVYPYQFGRNNNYKVKIIYFSLEKKRHIVKSHLISNLYYQETHNRISKQELFTRKMDANTRYNVNQLSMKYDDVDDRIDIVDYLHSPTDIQKYVRKYMAEHGKFETVEGKKTYISNEDEHVIVVTDTLNALTVMKDKTKADTIYHFSQEVCKNEFCELYDITVVNIQQQNKEQEKNHYNFKGELNEAATKPSRNSLGESLQTFNNCDFLLTLYSPFNYRIGSYPFNAKYAYDITRLKDKFMLISCEKNRDGDAPFEIELYSDLAVNYFEELPPVESFYNNDALYKKYQNYVPKNNANLLLF
jgi:hypothetical protein